MFSEDLMPERKLRNFSRPGVAGKVSNETHERHKRNCTNFKPDLFAICLNQMIMNYNSIPGVAEKLTDSNTPNPEEAYLLIRTVWEGYKSYRSIRGSEKGWEGVRENTLYHITGLPEERVRLYNHKRLFLLKWHNHSLYGNVVSSLNKFYRISGKVLDLILNRYGVLDFEESALYFGIEPPKFPPGWVAKDYVKSQSRMDEAKSVDQITVISNGGI